MSDREQSEVTVSPESTVGGPPGEPPPSRVPAPPPVELPGDLTGRFKLVGTLGRGGMGVVLLVLDRRLEREVALKLMRFEDEQHAKLFQKEARISAGLEHDNVVRLYEYGTANDRQYLVMEYVRGPSLAARLAVGRPTVVEAVRIAADILRGIEEAHRVDIVHRDLKPANVFLEASGRAKVADFGLAVAGKDETAGRLAGTPGYMSPEQTRREQVGPASDVFSAGIILHEMLTGRRLFSGATLDAVLDATRTRPPAPSRVNPAVPPALDELVAKALAAKPKDRPDAPTLRKSLEQWLERTSAGKRPAGASLPDRPYKLLEHFDVADAPIFFGRQAETLELAGLLDNPELRLISAFGPCGIGKSSLLRAGLVPALDARWEPVVLRAGAHPAALIRAALSGLASKYTEAAALPWELEAEPNRVDALLADVERATGRGLVLIVDQAEEVFTLNAAGSPRVADLFALLERLAMTAARAKVILSFRTEFRGAFFALEERLGARQQPYAVRTIGFAGLLEAVEGPVREESYKFVYDRGLPQKIAGDVQRTAQESGDVAPALLQIVCRQLYDHMRQALGRVITGEMYRTTVGGARGALRRYVEQRLASPDYEARGSIARQMIKALTIKEEGGERYARSRDEDELLAFPDREAARHTLERLISDHLVLREAGLEGRFRVRLASEVICPLVDVWQVEPDLAEQAARVLDRGHARWREAKKSGAELLSGSALALVERERRHLSSLSESETAYLDASLARRRRRRLTAAAATAGALVLTAAAAWFTLFQPGQLAIDSDPSGATVTEAGQKLGVTPFAAWLRPGVHSLQIAYPRHETAGIEVDVPVGGRTEHRPVLRFPYGLVSLSSDPPGATAMLYRQGATEGAVPVMPPFRTPITTEVPEGDLRLELTLPGYADVKIEPVRVGANRRLVQLAPKLQRITGTLSVEAPYPSVKATLTHLGSGQKLGPFALPLAPQVLAAGAWRVDAYSPTTLADTRQVTLRRDAHEQLTVWTPFVRSIWEQKLAGEVFAAPALADLDGDGAPDVAVAEGRELFAREGRTGNELWRYAAQEAIWSSPAVCDLDGDGTADLVFGANDDQVHAVSGKSGKALWKHAAGGHVVSSPCVVPTSSPLIVVGSDAGRIVALRADGTVAWQVDTGGKIRSSPALADLDGDERPELAVGSADGQLRVLDPADGRLIWQHPMGADANGAPALADLDGDGKRDVVIGAMDNRVHALDHRGRPLWTADTGGELRAGVAVGDLDLDGKPEVVAASLDNKLQVLEGATGKLKWARNLGAPLIASPVLHDVDGDGAPEILIGSQDGVLHGVSGRDGAPVLALQRSGPIAAPVGLADLDGDGADDLVYASWYDKLFALRGRTRRPAWATRVNTDRAPAPAGFTPYDVNGDGCQDFAIGDGLGELRLISGVDGKSLWAVAAGGRVSSAPAIGDVDASGVADVVVPLAEGGVRAFSGKDGSLLWRTKTGKQFRGAPRLLDVSEQGRPDVAIGDLQGAVRLLDGRTGKPLWERHDSGAVAHSIALVRPERSAALHLMVAREGARLECLDSAKGRSRWSVKLPGDPLAAPAPCDIDHDGEMEVATVTGDGSLHIVRARDGSVAWTGPCTGTGSVSPLPAYLFPGQSPYLLVGTQSGHVRALTPDTLRPAWEIRLPGAVVALGLASLDRPQVRDVLVATDDGFARVLSGDSGAVLASVDLTSAGLATPHVAPVGADQRDALVEVHLGTTLVASLLERPLVAAREPRVFSFTSGSGRWRDTRSRR